MKVFISHSAVDKPFVRKLYDALSAEGIEAWMDEFEIAPGDNIIQAIEEGLKQCDYIIPVLSQAYVKSKWAMQELSTFTMREISESNKSVLPALLEDCDIPIFLRDRLYADFRNEFDRPFQQLIAALTRTEPTPSVAPTAKASTRCKEKSLAHHSRILRKHLRDGELTLVCGAGVSAAAGAPTWPVLLSELLSNLIKKNLDDSPKSPEDQRRLANLYQEYFSPTALIVAQYLKNGLGNDFLPTVRDALYKNTTNSSSLLDSIVELCRPQRSRESLRSIITFNFDDLIEDNLTKSHIKHCPVYSEGQKPSRSELPVYHVHGFLPRSGDLSEQHHVVFSEDAYHSQFIDQFSWSNLIQLNHFSHNICLFIGVSMTDPNLRRLLDVSMRKNPGRNAFHFVFKKRYDASTLNNRIAELNLVGDDATTAKNFIGMSEVLEEQDSSNLGLNTIWIDDYSEIPRFLNELTHEG